MPVPPDPGALGHAGTPPVAAHHHAAGKRLAAIERQGHAGRSNLLRRHRRAVDQPHPRMRGHGVKKGAGKEAVFDHVAHRALVQLPVLELENEGAGA